MLIACDVWRIELRGKGNPYRKHVTILHSYLPINEGD